MNKNTGIPPTQNEGWGFWGTMADHAAAAWPLAMSAIAKATGEPFEAIRLFLDSRFGRHFADDVMNRMSVGCALPEAITATITQWMHWKISRHHQTYAGIPHRLPYLTGHVLACVIDDAVAMRGR